MIFLIRNWIDLPLSELLHWMKTFCFKKFYNVHLFFLIIQKYNFTFSASNNNNSKTKKNKDLTDENQREKKYLFIPEIEVNCTNKQLTITEKERKAEKKVFEVCFSCCRKKSLFKFFTTSTDFAFGCAFIRRSVFTFETFVSWSWCFLEKSRFILQKNKIIQWNTYSFFYRCRNCMWYAKEWI